VLGLERMGGVWRGVVWCDIASALCTVGRCDKVEELVWYVGWSSGTVDEMLRIDTQCGERAGLGIQAWSGIVLRRDVRLKVGKRRGFDHGKLGTEKWECIDRQSA
jgi:hypothetical protein